MADKGYPSLPDAGENIDNSANWIAAQRAGRTDRQLDLNYDTQARNNATNQQAGNALADDPDNLDAVRDIYARGGRPDLAFDVQDRIKKTSNEELADHALKNQKLSAAVQEANDFDHIDQVSAAAKLAGYNTGQYAPLIDKYRNVPGGLDVVKKTILADTGQLQTHLEGVAKQRAENQKTLGQMSLATQGDDPKLVEGLMLAKHAGIPVDHLLAPRQTFGPMDQETPTQQGYALAPGARALIEGQGGQGAAVFKAESAADLAERKAKVEADKAVPISKVSPELTGDDVLKALPAGTAALVKKYANYELPLPGGFALSKPYWQNMMQLVSQYDPNFDAINYGARQKTRNDFTSGKSAQNVTSFNTAIGHLGDLDAAIDPLNNTGYTFVNRNLNAYQGASNPRVKSALNNFNASKQAVVDELTRAFRGSGGNVHDIKGWEESINAADSPEALHTSVKKAVELLRSRIESVGDQYNRGMGTTKDPVQLLSPKAQKVFQKLTGEDGGSAASSSPIQVKSPEEAAKLEPGTTFIDEYGVRRIRH